MGIFQLLGAYPSQFVVLLTLRRKGVEELASQSGESPKFSVGVHFVSENVTGFLLIYEFKKRLQAKFHLEKATHSLFKAN
jgi:hypothetical protein